MLILGRRAGSLKDGEDGVPRCAQRVDPTIARDVLEPQPLLEALAAARTRAAAGCRDDFAAAGRRPRMLPIVLSVPTSG